MKTEEQQKLDEQIHDIKNMMQVNLFTIHSIEKMNEKLQKIIDDTKSMFTA